MERTFAIETYGKNGLVSKTVEDYNHDVFLVIGDKRYRFSVDNNDNLSFALINGCDVKIITESGYPAVKLIGR